MEKSMLFLVLVLSVSAIVVNGERMRMRMRMRWSRKELVEMAGYGELKLSSILISASLLSSSSSSFPIPGATVGIKCETGLGSSSKWIKAVTNELGQFVIDLPSHLHAIPDLDKSCLIKPLFIPKRYRCSSKIHTGGIKLLSSSNGSRVYTAGNITTPCKKRF